MRERRNSALPNSADEADPDKVLAAKVPVLGRLIAPGSGGTGQEYGTTEILQLFLSHPLDCGTLNEPVSSMQCPLPGRQGPIFEPKFRESS